MSRSLAFTIALSALIVLAFGVGIGRSCPAKPSKAERRADTVLADTTRFLQERAKRDSIIAAGQAENLKLKDQIRRTKAENQALLDSVDHERAEAATLTPLPSGITPHDSIVRLDAAMQAQIKVAARLRDQAIPKLLYTIRLDSLTIDRQDATIADQLIALRTEYKRNDELTVALRDLRKDGSKSGKFLGFLPPWTDEALLAGGAGYLGYRIGKSSH